MCMLSYLPPKVMPDMTELRNGTEINPDGHGFAVHAGDRLITGHSLDAETALADFEEVRDLYPYGPALFHSRITTSGATDLTNCHPFRIGNDPLTVMAHNGILFSPPADEQRSDTRIWAEEIMPVKYFRLDKETVRDQIRWRIGRNNKFVIITANPRYKCSAYIINQQAGIWSKDSGIWHSNDGYKPFLPRRSYVASSMYDCYFCMSTGTVSGWSDICYRCNLCQYCEMVRADCECYRPQGGYGRRFPRVLGATASTTQTTFAVTGQGEVTADTSVPSTAFLAAGDDNAPWCPCTVRPWTKVINGVTMYECPKCHTAWSLPAAREHLTATGGDTHGRNATAEQ